MLWQRKFDIQESAVGVPVTVWRDLSPPLPYPYTGLTLCHWKTEGNHRAGGPDRAPGTGQRWQDHPAEEPRLRGREHHHTDAGDGGHLQRVLWHHGQLWTRLNNLQTPLSDSLWNNCRAFGNDFVHFTWGWNPGLSDLAGLYLISWVQLDQHTLPHKVAELRHLLLS